MNTFLENYQRWVERRKYEVRPKDFPAFHHNRDWEDHKFWFETDGNTYYINGMRLPKEKYEDFLDDFIESIRNSKHISEYDVLKFGVEHFHTREQMYQMDRPVKYFIGGFEVSGPEKHRLYDKLYNSTDIACFGKAWGFDYYKEVEPGALIYVG